MNTNNLYFAVVKNQEQAIQISIDDIQTENPDYIAIYAVDRELNNMPLEDLLNYLPAFHHDPDGYVTRSGINLYCGVLPN